MWSPLYVLALVCGGITWAESTIWVGSGLGGMELQVDDAAWAVVTPGTAAPTFRGVHADRLAAALGNLPGGRAAAVAHPRGQAGNARREFILTHRVLFQPKPGGSADALAARHRARLEGRLDARTWIATATDTHPLAGVEAAGRLAADAGVAWAEVEVRFPAVPKATPDDTLFAQQWALANDGSVAGTTAGVDLNLVTAWDFGTGSASNVAIVDTGIQLDHPDLAAAVVSALAKDLFDSAGNGPVPGGPGENHGTFTAGLAVARGFDGYGICGTAPAAGLAPVRLLTGTSFSDATAVQALLTGEIPSTIAGPVVDVSSNSWGAADYPDLTFKPATSTLASGFAEGTSVGRHGRGIVYVFAAGNGGIDDDTAYDGYQQFRQVISVGAVDGHGLAASYSEPGANLLVTAPAGDFGGAGAVSTDRTSSLGYVAGDHALPADELVGTSFAAPLVSGVAALLLDRNPLLTWRDVQHVLVRTARDNAEAGWQTNGAGRPYHHRLGYGLVDAAAAVALCAGWTPVPQEANVAVSGTGTGPILDLSTRSLSFDAGAAGDLRLEAAVLTCSINHARWGDVALVLRSPAGTQARIEARPEDTDTGTRTVTVACRPFWDEAAAGTWTLDVTDLASGKTGTITAASLTLYGWRPYPVPAPDASSATVRVGAASATVTITGTGFASDAAGLTPVTTVTWQRGGASGTATVVSATATSLVVLLPPAALAGAIGDTITITAANPAFGGLGGGASAATTALTLRGNLPPVLADATVTAPVNGTVQVALAASDPDDDALAFTAAATGLGTIGFTGSTLDFTAGAVPGTGTVAITADDGQGGSTTATVAITVVRPTSSSDDDGGSGGCGSGMFGAALVLLAGLRRRRIDEQA